MITFCPFVVEVNTELGEGYLFYVRSNFLYANDEYCVILKDSGKPRFFSANQITIVKNDTYGIKNNQ